MYFQPLKEGDAFFFLLYKYFLQLNSKNNCKVEKKCIFQPLKDDDVLNAVKNKLDDAEGSPKKTPMVEESGIVDCNENALNVEELSKKVYR